MPEPVGILRPRVDTYPGEGWQLVVVDAPGILAAAADRPVELLHGTVFPPPVRLARLSVAAGDADGEPAYLLTGHVHAGAPEAGGRVSIAAFGSDPLGYLLSRRAAAGDQWAIRVTDGLDSAVSALSRRLGMASPAPAKSAEEPGEPLRSEVVTDGETGLRTTVTTHAAAGDDARAVVLRAAVPVGTMTAAHLAAFFTALVGAVGDLPGSQPEEPGIPHTFVLSADPAGTAPETGGATLADVGGLDPVVERFREIAMSFRHPQAMARWGARRPQGILLYGPAGTGKTMLARALAHEIGAEIREIRTPEILDKWLGASERNIKRIFGEARRYRVPTVMLFDEFDSIISYTGAGGDSGSQAINAVAGIFKQEMNNLIDENPHVIVVATTNFPQLIDDSLIRSGRFDVKLEIPAPDATGRAQILARMIRGLIAAHEVAGFRMFADDLDVDALAALGDGMTGADLREVLRRAQMAKAMHEARTGIPAAPISQDDLRGHLDELRRGQ